MRDRRFEALVAEHLPALRAYARALSGRSGDADEVAATRR